MNEDHTGTRDFRPDYAVLGLTEKADWSSVRTNYRRLVHLWHPDRYAQRPRERAHAQQQFISLTVSYTHLRSFHRQYGRLPFEPPPRRTIDETLETAPPPRETAPPPRTEAQTSAEDKIDWSTTDTETLGTVVESGVLGRGKTARSSALKSRSNSRITWILAGCALLLSTISIFLVLDKKASQAIIERGREAVREAPASDFMPSPAEIRKGEAKGAFVKPTR